MKKKLNELIKSNPNIVDFGDENNAASEDWIKKAEDYLGYTFPDSYLWFLKNYSGGEIAGEEIFSIYGLDFETVFGGDIIFQHIINQKEKLLSPHQLAIEINDFGELFYFDLLKYSNNEYQIFVRLPSGEEKFYAKDFYEFLYKRIMYYLDNK